MGWLWLWVPVLSNRTVLGALFSFAYLYVACSVFLATNRSAVDVQLKAYRTDGICGQGSGVCRAPNTCDAEFGFLKRTRDQIDFLSEAAR